LHQSISKLGQCHHPKSSRERTSRSKRNSASKRIGINLFTKIDLPYLCHSEIINCNIYTNFMQKIPKEVIYIAKPCYEMGLRELERDLSPNSEEVVRLYSN
jgi:hypothetical protein